LPHDSESLLGLCGIGNRAARSPTSRLKPTSPSSPAIPEASSGHCIPCAANRWISTVRKNLCDFAGIQRNAAEPQPNLTKFEARAWRSGTFQWLRCIKTATLRAAPAGVSLQDLAHTCTVKMPAPAARGSKGFPRKTRKKTRQIRHPLQPAEPAQHQHIRRP